MSSKNKEYLKGRFANGCVPDETDFEDLLDSGVNKQDDVDATIPATAQAGHVPSSGAVKEYVGRVAPTKDELTQLSTQVSDLERNDTTQDGLISSLQHQIENVEQVTVEGNVTNNPDQEDLTIVNNQLKLKDRAYTQNGMGYVILRKGTALSEQITLQNTIYEVRYNYSLNEGNLSLPKGSVLRFCGGVISNGTIIGDASLIEGAEYGALDNILLSGTFKNFSSSLSWWGCSKDTDFDNSSKIDKAFRSSIKNVEIPGLFGVSSPIKLAGGKKYYGVANPGEGNTICGFIANTSFAANTESSGVLYCGKYSHCQIENIVIKCEYKAKYGIEHIGGYANVNITNVDIFNASQVGLLMYGFESVKFDNLCTRNCRIGAFISSSKYIEDAPFQNGATTSSPDMCLLERCRFIGGNYGIFIKNGSNYQLTSCETSDNSILGMWLENSIFSITDYYSERDGYCNKFILSDGSVIYSDSAGNSTTNKDDSDYSRSCPYLVTNNMDGQPVIYGNGASQNAYSRFVVGVKSANVHMVSSFLSFKPRSYKDSNALAADVVEMTDRGASGIDSFFYIANGNPSILIIDAINLFAHSSGSSANSLPFAGVIDTANATSKIIATCWFSFTIYREYHSDNGIPDFKVGKETNGVGYFSADKGVVYSINRLGYSYPNYNVDVDERKCGFNQNAMKPFKYFSFKENFNRFPLYKRDVSLASYNYSRFDKDFIANIANSHNNRVKVMLCVRFVEDCTSKVTVQIQSRNTSNAVISNYSSNSQAAKTISAGYYIYSGVLKVPEPTAEDLSYYGISVVVDNEASIQAYVSPIYLFAPEDPVMEIPAPIHSPSLVQGITSWRPFEPSVGQQYFDTTIGKMIVYNGTSWVNLDGTALS